MSKPPTQIVVVGAGHWRGEGMALVEAIREHGLGGGYHGQHHAINSACPSSSSPAWASSPPSAQVRQTTGPSSRAAKSGIRTISRFPIESLRTTMAGTVDFILSIPLPSSGLSERLAELATEEALGQSGVGRKGDFRAPSSLRSPPSRSNGRSAWSWGPRHRQAGDRLQRHAARQRWAESSTPTMTASSSARLQIISPKSRNQGFADFACRTACASGATAIQLGVEAIRRGRDGPSRCAWPPRRRSIPKP